MESIIKQYQDLVDQYGLRYNKDENDKDAEIIVDLATRMVEILETISEGQIAEGILVGADMELQTVTIQLDKFDDLVIKIGAMAEVSIEK